jgi:DNA-directed RNA polymerase specialized sigma24 family protein
MVTNRHREPEDATDTGQVPPAALPEEAESADVLEQLNEVPDPDEEVVVLDDDPNGQQIDPSDPWDRPGI